MRFTLNITLRAIIGNCLQCDRKWGHGVEGGGGVHRFTAYPEHKQVCSGD